MKKKYLIMYICVFGLITSLTYNYLQYKDIYKLKYKLQKLEAGPWRSLFDNTPLSPDYKEKKKESINQNKGDLDLVTKYT
jgi:hypothetical protein